jgi:HAD superfamily hydrolase (TIGR01490 family)
MSNAGCKAGSNRLSVFDLDHTLVTCNSSFAFGKFLFQRGIYSQLDMATLLAAYGAHVVGLLSIKRLHKIIFNIFFRGKSKKLFCDHVELFLDDSLDKIINAEVYNKLLEAKHAGGCVAIFSSGPDFLVEAIARRFDIQHVLATTYSISDAGIFSAVTDIILGAQKATALRQMLDKFSLASSIAYSDSSLDIPLLVAASHAVAVSPDRRLKKLALQRGWSIIPSPSHKK